MAAISELAGTLSFQYVLDAPDQVRVRLITSGMMSLDFLRGCQT